MNIKNTIWDLKNQNFWGNSSINNGLKTSTDVFCGLGSVPISWSGESGSHRGGHLIAQFP